jgi:hypothetical protein
MTCKPCALSLAASLLTIGHSVAQSVWLPSAGELRATPGFSYSSFDSFWMGTTKVDNPPNGKRLDQFTGYLSLEYGIIENLAADVTIGYTWTDTDAFGGSASDDGLADTFLGLRYRLLDENAVSSPWVPSLAIRVGGVIAGTYDSNLPFSAGDEANGLEGSLLLGKAFGDSGFGMYGDFGYRWREDPVPDDLFGSVGLYKQFGPVTAVVGYRQVYGRSGLDIGGPGFDPAAGRSSGFPALQEINHLGEGGLAFTDGGGRNYQFTVAKSIDGRNTGDKLIFGFNITFPFGGRSPEVRQFAPQK